MRSLREKCQWPSMLTLTNTYLANQNVTPNIFYAFLASTHDDASYNNTFPKQQPDK